MGRLAKNLEGLSLYMQRKITPEDRGRKLPTRLVGMSEKGGGGGGRFFLIRLLSSEFPSPKPQCAYMDTEDLVRSFPESNNVVGEITIRNIRGFSLAGVVL